MLLTNSRGLTPCYSHVTPCYSDPMLLVTLHVTLESADVAQIRLMLDDLLRVEEGRYYFSAPRIDHRGNED